ncbi:helix-turn-helix domain-containing protein [Streptomyces sp. URMC 124]|uniref:helix-turn-helix domain-containing protein n=1 Tax=Streptomyces sp. URMC 124 TaxID=3423405 RepID=UPI003F1DBF80
MGQQAQRTARRRKLGTAPKEAREAAGVTATRAGEEILGDITRISRLETGQRRIAPLELEKLLNLYTVESTKEREWFFALASEGRKRNWWRQYSEMLPSGFKETLSVEADAAKISVCQTQVVPGLLQTRDYARVVMSGSPEPLTDEELAFYIDFRMKRQQLLERKAPPQYVCIMTEGVIRQRLGGPSVMAGQLRRLLAASALPQVTIQIVPFAEHTFTCTAGSFNLYTYPDPMDFEVVQVSTLDAELFLEEDDRVATYRTAFANLRNAALSAQESMQLIATIANELEQE